MLELHYPMIQFLINIYIPIYNIYILILYIFYIYLYIIYVCMRSMIFKVQVHLLWECSIVELGQRSNSTEKKYTVRYSWSNIWWSIYHCTRSVQRCGREKCIKRYETYVRSNEFLMREIPSLKGKTLGCWCKQQKCHGDVSARFADESKQIDGFFE